MTFYFVGEVVAHNDLWLIGDDFMGQTYYMLDKLKRDAVTSRSPIPYIFEYYNVKAFYVAEDHLIKDVLARFVNALILALNDISKISRLVIVIPDEDIIQHVDFTASGTRFVLGAAITWVVSQMSRAVEAKKDNLLRRRAGAVIANEPKMIWIKALKKAHSSSDDRAQINKFNSMLEDILADSAGHYLMDVSDAMHGLELFTLQNDLNTYSMQQYWQDVNKQIELFEKRKLSLQPLHQFHDAHDSCPIETDRSSEEPCPSLPKPPPRKSSPYDTHENSTCRHDTSRPRSRWSRFNNSRHDQHQRDHDRNR